GQGRAYARIAPRPRMGRPVADRGLSRSPEGDNRGPYAKPRTDGTGTPGSSARRAAPDCRALRRTAHSPIRAGSCKPGDEWNARASVDKPFFDERLDAMSDFLHRRLGQVIRV